MPLLANLDADDAEFLTRIAILDDLHPDLCREMTGMPDAAERLARLARDTPVFVAGEGSDWLRMHALARDALRERFARLPPDEQRRAARARRELAGRAWLLEEAARHALAAGQRETAYDLAERSLYESLMRAARPGRGARMAGRMPAGESSTAGRACCWPRPGRWRVSERHDEAEPLVERILAQARRRCGAALRMRADPERRRGLRRRSRPLRRAARPVGADRRR